MEDELVQLVDVYAAPGFLLLARSSGSERAGCAGVRYITESNGEVVGEVRRLFVRDQFRGGGQGRQMVRELIERARVAGFQKLVLNTLPAMTEAIGLYRSLGFVHCDPYVDEPLDGTMYFSLALGPQ